MSVALSLFVDLIGAYIVVPPCSDRTYVSDRLTAPSKIARVPADWRLAGGVCTEGRDVASSEDVAGRQTEPQCFPANAYDWVTWRGGRPEVYAVYLTQVDMCTWARTSNEYGVLGVG